MTNQSKTPAAVNDQTEEHNPPDGITKWQTMSKSNDQTDEHNEAHVTTKWQTMSASVMGSSHKKSGLPNQDRVRCEPQSADDEAGHEAVVVAVADGHGSAKSFRSDKGAQFAVDVAVGLLKIVDGNNPSGIKDLAEDRIPQFLVHGWRKLVDEDLRKTLPKTDGSDVSPVTTEREPIESIAQDTGANVQSACGPQNGRDESTSGPFNETDSCGESAGDREPAAPTDINANRAADGSTPTETGSRNQPDSATPTDGEPVDGQTTELVSGPGATAGGECQNNLRNDSLEGGNHAHSSTPQDADARSESESPTHGEGPPGAGDGGSDPSIVGKTPNHVDGQPAEVGSGPNASAVGDPITHVDHQLAAQASAPDENEPQRTGGEDKSPCAKQAVSTADGVKQESVSANEHKSNGNTELKADDSKVNNFTNEELKRLTDKEGEKAVQAVIKNPYLAYGATLLIALVTDKYGLYMQIGDGDIVVVDSSGKPERPIPTDDRLFANATTSLCMKGAWKDFRFAFSIFELSRPAMIMLSTDGYSNSFASEDGFLKASEDIARMVKANDKGEVDKSMKGWLDEASKNGSGDDVTVGILLPCNESCIESELNENPPATTQQATPADDPKMLRGEALPIEGDSPSDQGETIVAENGISPPRGAPLVAEDEAPPAQEQQPEAPTNVPTAEELYQTGRRYYQGEGVAQDFAEAARWYRKAADQGHPEAQYHLGLIYFKGEGVAQDFAEAARWFRMAAKLKQTDAQYHLGLLYFNGKGVKHDNTDAARWFYNAADQGLTEAQCNLGYCYENGLGVSQDLQKAVDWYRKATEQGNSYAKSRLLSIERPQPSWLEGLRRRVRGLKGGN